MRTLSWICAVGLFVTAGTALADDATEPGFKAIFDGNTLDGWNAVDMSYWSVEDGAITGTITKEHPLDKNLYLVWQGGELADFELKLKSRLTGTPGVNNGFQFRSKLLPDHDIAGYQVDNNLNTDWRVRLYDEHGRETLAMRGTRTVFDANGAAMKTEIPGATGPAHFRLDDWHEYHLICVGPKLTLKINGQLVAEVIDNDPKQRDLSGILALQLHSGPPTRVQFKDIRVKVLGQAGGETLYNGIRLPKPWPPAEGATNYEPMQIPYLESPPEVIPIDVGRQLFVDDFLVKETTLKRTFHVAEFHPKCPVLKPDRPWEMVYKDMNSLTTAQGETAGGTATPFSDGVWFDPADNLFKLWYMGGYAASTCMATSKDGVTWEKPSLDVTPGTNVVLEEPAGPKRRDSSTVWLDLDEKDPARRYKLFVVRIWKDPEKKTGRTAYWTGFVYESPDGIHWGKPVARTGFIGGDRTTIFYNPFRKVWVYSKRTQLPFDPRWRGYFETPELIADAPKAFGGSPWTTLWIGADKNDPPRPDIKGQPELYNLDAVAYESLMLGLFTIWPGQPEDRAKPNYLCLGFSRDGFHWDRPDHRPFINVSEHYGDWNWGNIQSAGGGCLVVGDKLYFYFSARAGIKGSKASGACTTGLAILRRDGFASMDAGQTEGTLTTQPIRFDGKHLFVNLDAKQGELRVEAIDAQGKPIAPFTKENCEPLTTDATLAAVKWRGADDLSALAGKPVSLRFHLTNGRLYSFWISPDQSGASHGYVAAGGPGFTTPRDKVGAAAYEAAKNTR